jgi:hypothetical protein
MKKVTAHIGVLAVEPQIGVPVARDGQCPDMARVGRA